MDPSKMKTFNRGLKTLSIFIMLVAFGCSKNKSNSSDVATAVVPPAVVPPAVNVLPGTGTVGVNGGYTVDFTPKDLATMTDYVAINPLNNPTNFKINVNLRQVTSGGQRYGGDVTISYIDNGITRQGVFTAGSGKNQDLPGLRDSGKLEAEYNYWFQYNSRTVFSGYFQDTYGAIVVVISRDESSGSSADAEGISGAYTGHVYYKNFEKQFSIQSPYRSCWYIYNGPYDCRSEIVSTKCGLYPEAGYKFLGSFKNLDINKAFNL